MKDLSESCLKCGKKEGLIFNAEIDTDQGGKHVLVKICHQCLEFRPISEQVEKVLSDKPVNWKNI